MDEVEEAGGEEAMEAEVEEHQSPLPTSDGDGMMHQLMQSSSQHPQHSALVPDPSHPLCKGRQLQQQQ